MSIIEMDSKIKELRELRRMADELQAEIDSLQDTIKRLDSTALKKELPEIAARFMKQTTARRFVLA